MTWDPARVQVILMDSYSTLLDVAAAARALEGKVADPAAVARAWRAESLLYAMMCNFQQTYEPFYELNRRALDFALAQAQVSLPAAQRDAVLSVYHHLDVFPDVGPGLTRLHEAGYPLYILSNGDPDMLESLVAIAGIGALVSGVISAQEVRCFKPDARLYQHALARVGVPAGSIVHVSAGWFDVAGAQLAGMQGIWMNRAGGPRHPFGPQADQVVQDFYGVMAALGVPR